MPIVALPDGNTVDVPDDLSPEQKLAFRQKMHDTYVRPKIDQYNDAVKRKDNVAASALHDEIAKLNPKQVVGAKKESSVWDKIGSDPIGAAAEFGKGATDALRATARGATLGLTDYAEAAGATVTGGDFNKQLDRVRQEAEVRDAKHGGAKFVGELVGFGKGAQALKGLGVTGMGAQGAILAGGQALSEGGKLADAGVSAAIGAVGGKVGEAIAPHVARVAAPIIETFTKRAPGSTGRALDQGVVRSIATRVKASPEEVRLAVAEWTDVHGSPPSFAEIADTETVLRYASMARKRDTVAKGFADAERESILRRADDMRGVVTDGGPVASAVASGDDLTRGAARQTRAAEDALEQAGTAGREARAALRRRTGKQSGALSGETTLSQEVTDWGTRTMGRETGGVPLRDLPVTFGREILESVPAQALRRAMESIAATATGVEQRTVQQAIDTIFNARNADGILSIGQIDTLRQMMNAASRRAVGENKVNLRAGADYLRDLAPVEYQNFVRDYGLLKRATGNIGKMRQVLGKDADTAVLAARIAADQEALVRALGPEDGPRVANEIARLLNQIDDAGADRQAAKMAMRQIKEILAADKRAVNAASKVLTAADGEFAAAVGPNAPAAVAPVARGAVADAVGESPASALRTASNLAEGGAARRLDRVLPTGEADRLRALGRQEVKAAENLRVMAGKPAVSAKVIAEEISDAVDVVGLATGKAGMWFVLNRAKDIVSMLSRLGVSNDKAAKMVSAFTSREPEIVAKLIAGLDQKLANIESVRDVFRVTIPQMAAEPTSADFMREPNAAQ